VLAAAAHAAAHQPLLPDGWHHARRFRLCALKESYYMLTNPTLIKILGNYFTRSMRKKKVYKTITKKPTVFPRTQLRHQHHQLLTGLADLGARQDDVTYCLS